MAARAFARREVHARRLGLRALSCWILSGFLACASICGCRSHPKRAAHPPPAPAASATTSPVASDLTASASKAVDPMVAKSNVGASHAPRAATPRASPPVRLAAHQNTQPEELPPVVPVPQGVVQPAGPLLPTPIANQAARAAPNSNALTLDDALAIGMQYNPRLREKAARAEAASASADIAYAPFLPQIGAGFRYSGFSQPVLPGGSFVPASLATGVTSFSVAEAGIQWMLYDFGRTAGQYGQALDRARIAELAVVRARQTVAFEIAQAYFRLLAANARLRVREEALRQAQSILDDTKARLIGGVVDREGLLRAEVEVMRARERLSYAQRDLHDGEAMLSVTLGRSAAVPLEIVDVDARPTLERSFEGCLQWAANNRQEIRMAYAALAEAHRSVQAAEGEFLPKIYTRGTVLRADSPGPLNAWIEGIGLHIDQPIYAGGAHRGELRRSHAEVSAAVAALQSMLDQVSLQVSLSYQAIASDLERIRLGEMAVGQARENLRLVVVNYNNGNATPTDVVDAQTALLEAQTSFYDAVYGYLADLAQLEYAVGNDQSGLAAVLRACESQQQVPPAEP